jgi:hypothetical protein
MMGQERADQPTAELFYQEFQYSSASCDLTKAQVANLQVRSWFHGTDRVDVDTVPLRDGKYEEKWEHTGAKNVEIIDLYLISSDRKQPKQAAAVFRWEWIAGGSSQSTVVSVRLSQETPLYFTADLSRCTRFRCRGMVRRANWHLDLEVCSVWFRSALLPGVSGRSHVSMVGLGFPTGRVEDWKDGPYRIKPRILCSVANSWLT